MAMAVKNTVFWDMMQYSLPAIYKIRVRYKGRRKRHCSVSKQMADWKEERDHEDDGNTLLRNVVKFLPLHVVTPQALVIIVDKY